ncbi:MAG: transcription elongation factor GreA [Hyphomicrobiales bacterium]|nr:transcription elongation factor GreA [Hyphomicrobiales bacterium]
MKEPAGDVFDDIADRPVSPHRNLVTPEGLAQIDAEIERAHAQVTQAQEAEDRTAVARAQRDLRYWQARRGSAELVPALTDKAKVHFGSNVKIRYADGREMQFRIVGEDEADPAKGTISYVSPMARALISKEVGEEASAGGQDVEIVGIE